MSYKKTLPTTEYPGFVYQEKGNRHNYFLDKVLMTGVTTVLGVAGDTGGLQVWYGNLAAAKAFMTGTPAGFKENYESIIKKFGKLNSEAARELDKLAFYTPTPGGTGPILVAKLFQNFYTLNK